MPLGGVQRGRHGAVTVLVVCLWAGSVALVQRAGGPQAESLIVPGLAAAVSLAVHGALVPRQPSLVLLPLLRRRGLVVSGPPQLLGGGSLLWLGGAKQASHRQHPLNGLFCAG